MPERLHPALNDAWAAIDNRQLEEILLESLAIYSPSGKEEDVQDYYAGLLSSAGFIVGRQTVEPGRDNLLVTLGAQAPRLLLVGHVDTVPAWDLNDMEPSIKNRVISGLGAADMKGGCAAMIAAMLALKKSVPYAELPPVGLLLVVDEEENGDGSNAYLADHPLPEWAVIGEPTSLSACFEHYGYLEISLSTRGRRIHSSLPELGHNAIESMLRLLLQFGRAPLFDRSDGNLVYSIREMTSSRAGFVVPDTCEAWIDVHLPPQHPLNEVKQQVRALCAAAEEQIEGLNLDVSFPFRAAGYRIGRNNPLATTLTDTFPHLGRTLKFEAFRSHSDGNLFHRAGVKPLILGPGALETAHTPDEQVKMDEVEMAARIYTALCLGVTG
jgi:acetylornithine deacetylase